MTTPTGPWDNDPALSDPRAAHLVEAFRDALVRMREGEELTIQDLTTATDLLQVVQATTGASLAAAVMPLFEEVFQSGRDGSAPDEESTVPAAHPVPHASATPTPCPCDGRNPEPPGGEGTAAFGAGEPRSVVAGAITTPAA
ncbi:hypothetical protein [Streptomyces sp. NL15-2K]|uniref:hypothetical protein n=1 Tax=Streptomyces sp. NL15-2K TaxID=376149 RepID=UPI000F58BA7D|nr:MULTISPECIES: hypothetical protein [Actinomycetes]WKX14413.1 hypothetical protein Q4V64_45660 [Kutzneria buriramensis]GCB44518.1 hypothetical protein SNL152K_1808 [Streptomyces sp. NL15-2K]